VRFLFRDWAVFNTLRNNEYFAWTKADIAISHLYCDAPLEYQKKVVRFIVLVPDEWTFDFDDHEIVAVELADRSRLEVLGKQGELLGEIDSIHGWDVFALREVQGDTLAEVC
jgi:hypothetical protein